MAALNAGHLLENRSLRTTGVASAMKSSLNTVEENEIPASSHMFLDSVSVECSCSIRLGSTSYAVTEILSGFCESAHRRRTNAEVNAPSPAPASSNSTSRNPGLNIDAIRSATGFGVRNCPSSLRLSAGRYSLADFVVSTLISSSFVHHQVQRRVLRSMSRNIFNIADSYRSS